MRVEVDPELCISCGACIDTCPEIFDWNDEDKAVATTQDDLREDLEDCAHEAVESCPTEAIREH
ncbi:ferredoxin [Desulforudis sp. 1088]|uniref:ferredoxin n=1 Tax=unclassified Candidatus Desulforudis TaxID=2635950 RepID=UPI00346ED2DC